MKSFKKVLTGKPVVYTIFLFVAFFLSVPNGYGIVPQDPSQEQIPEAASSGAEQQFVDQKNAILDFVAPTQPEGDESNNDQDEGGSFGMGNGMNGLLSPDDFGVQVVSGVEHNEDGSWRETQYESVGGADKEVEVKEYSPEGRLTSRKTMEYYDDGSLKKEETRVYYPEEDGGGLAEKNITKYELGGETQLSSDSWTYYTDGKTWTLEKEGKEEDPKYEEGTGRLRRYTQNNADGSRKRTDYVEAGGKNLTSRVRTYNADGIVVRDEKRSYSDDGNLSAHRIRVYDDSGEVSVTDVRRYHESGGMRSRSIVDHKANTLRRRDRQAEEVHAEQCGRQPQENGLC